MITNNITMELEIGRITRCSMEKILALKKPHMEPSQLYDCREHVAHLCLEFASSSCGLK